MTPQEIKEKIDGLYEEIDTALHQGIFVLNPRIAEIHNEIEKLEEICPHEFDEEGHCKFCYFTKEEQEEEI